MPWTFAHPAAVLPFRRFGSRRVPFAGLVAGSMAPDIGYYFGRYDVGAFAHAPMGVVLFCVPVSMVLVLVVIRLRTLLTAPLPQPHRSALRAIEPFAPSSPRSLAALAAAALLGAVTHIVWDAFTHAPGTTTHSFAFLGRNALAL
ncbi:MAG TPA: DUF4184 family protein, partial [Ramlibacter sp.]|nr:DUF4184 family protein [Ramlibacter sp.]